ncbi:LPS translocon maturation chaperone LptM [Gluconobacter morbifer]|uniref:Lipoprotein n=1 Tax=Gluconobacter morbifer G707 TaxID=1088869 RepID=G6XGP5_9PROT|nr:lipoprotein [Gluconobacter morbifer]EHH69353.1 hypothetical protein GMO_06600 [Gluconobacter morbifer G707]
MKTLILVSMAVLALGLTACGRKGSPHAPGPDSDITYPRAYPPE